MLVYSCIYWFESAKHFVSVNKIRVFSDDRNRKISILIFLVRLNTIA